MICGLSVRQLSAYADKVDKVHQFKNTAAASSRSDQAGGLNSLKHGYSAQNTGFQMFVKQQYIHSRFKKKGIFLFVLKRSSREMNHIKIIQ
jgi:hypothetical protein